MSVQPVRDGVLALMRRTARVVTCVVLVASTQISSAAPPQAPGVTCDVTDYGAKGDGKALETAAIQRAVEACAARAAGRHVSLCAQQSHVYWQSHCANPLVEPSPSADQLTRPDLTGLQLPCM